MNLIMGSINFEKASIDQREKFSFTNNKKTFFYNYIKNNKFILGAVLISTCNRTELYLSCIKDYKVNPFKILCDFLNIDFLKFDEMYNIVYDKKVIEYLCKLACGVKSQIWGEDQIISQVKNSLENARENKTTDSIIEVAFRLAITSAKKVKTKVKMNTKENSIAFKILQVIKDFGNIKNVLIIGNGEIGRHIATVLVTYGYNVTVTLRQYHHSNNIVPIGCTCCDYSVRYEEMEKNDAVVSATLSPHLTVEFDKTNTQKVPKLFVDVAVPRDIDILIENLEGVTLFNIDDIYREEMKENREKQLEEIQKIIEKYTIDFFNWYKYKEMLLVTQ